MTTPIRNPYIPDGSVDPSPGGVTLASAVRTGQIITFGLSQGLVVIGLIFWLVLGGDDDDQAAEPDLLLPSLGLIAFAVMAFAALVIVRVLRAKALAEYRDEREPDAGRLSQDSTLSSAQSRLIAASQVWTLIGQAFVEGAGMLNLVLFVIDDHWIHLLIAALAIIAIIIQVPTINKKLALLEEGRQPA